MRTLQRNVRVHHVLYSLSFVLLIIVWWPSWSEHSRISAEESSLQDLAITSLPYTPADKIELQLEVVSQRIKRPAEYTAEEYFKILNECFRLRELTWKYEQLHGDEDFHFALRLMENTRWTLEELSANQRAFLDDSTREEIDQAREIYMDPRARDIHISYASAWQKAKRSYLASIPIFLLFFGVRLRRRNFRLMLEPHRISLAALMWPAGLFVYPTKLTEERQFQQAVAFASYAIVTIVSLAGVGTANAQTKKAGDKKKGADTELIAEKDPGLISISDPNPPQLAPTIHLRDVTFDLAGFSWTTYRENRDQEFGLSNLRLRGKVATTTPLSGFFDIDVASALKDGKLTGNWLQEGWFAIGLPGDWELRTGRLFLAAGYPTPPPFLLETAGYFSWPFGIFGTGMQLKGGIGDSWNLTMDVTGRSDTSFGESGQFERAESSAHLSRALSDEWAVAVTTQVSPEFQRFAVDSTWQPDGRHKLRGAMYWTHEEGGVIGGYSFYGYHPRDWLDLHSQIDIQSGSGYVIWTNGIGFRTTKDNLSLTMAHESRAGGGQFVARLQVRF